MGLIKRFAEWLLPIVLPYVYKALKEAWEAHQAKREIRRKNEETREQTESAKTQEERDAAAKNAADRF